MQPKTRFHHVVLSFAGKLCIPLALVIPGAAVPAAVLRGRAQIRQNLQNDQFPQASVERRTSPDFQPLPPVPPLPGDSAIELSLTQTNLADTHVQSVTAAKNVDKVKQEPSGASWFDAAPGEAITREDLLTNMSSDAVNSVSSTGIQAAQPDALSVAGSPIEILPSAPIVQPVSATPEQHPDTPESQSVTPEQVEQLQAQLQQTQAQLQQLQRLQQVQASQTVQQQPAPSTLRLRVAPQQAPALAPSQHQVAAPSQPQPAQKPASQQVQSPSLTQPQATAPSVALAAAATPSVSDARVALAHTATLVAVAAPAPSPVAAGAAFGAAPAQARPKGWDPCLQFARFVHAKAVTGVEMVRVWKTTCEPAVQNGRATNRYRLMCDSLGGVVEPFSHQADYNVEQLCDAVLAVFHDLTAADVQQRTSAAAV